MNKDAPEEIVYHKIGHTLEVAWPDARFDLPAELLRVFSPSAEVRGHSEQERVLQTGKKNVGIKTIDAIGNYAIRITFDDGHDSGIYAWDYLYDLGTNQTQHWQDYLSDLKQANASRLPTIPVGQWQPNKP
ncbi:MAG TPA: 1-(5-phosphoribosyl)-5-((5-phosphoribosylamino)methylideneamino)imidazole-4-carboxamide isomerase [Gammaproteobacteria bacterium]|nr:1-(5-phosphoribosyl)-5-((5-phosphoribosylamino)methylideneamino)imidazole-4-carboxamide isomerase [Gammaproteobacteria bacterium]|tara:strand:+ start:4768 stop:5160 length:393 start_codon:yes stop_codon:yes gene_type:complete